MASDESVGTCPVGDCKETSSATLQARDVGGDSASRPNDHTTACIACVSKSWPRRWSRVGLDLVHGPMLWARWLKALLFGAVCASARAVRLFCEVLLLLLID